jgi:hypothetical protein
MLVRGSCFWQECKEEMERKKDKMKQDHRYRPRINVNV